MLVNFTILIFIIDEPTSADQGSPPRIRNHS